MDVIYVRFSDGLVTIRQWSADPFEGGVRYVKADAMKDAAPDLLAALEDAYSELSADSTRDGPRCLLLTQIEAAIAKATAP